MIEADRKCEHGRRYSPQRGRLSTPAAAFLLSTVFVAQAAAGSFEGPVAWNFIPIHSALLPDGKVMTFGATPQDGQGGFDYDIWDPTKGTGPEAHQQLPNIINFDSFCVGAVLSPFNGSLIMAGGNANERVAQFDYKSSKAGLSETFRFKYPRYYASLATLPDGRLFVHGGSPSYGNQTNASAISEIFTPGQGWAALPGTADSPMRVGDQADTGNPFWYPHIYPIGGDEIFTIAGKFTYKINYSGQGSVSEVKAFNGSNYGATSAGLMYRPGLVMQIGGGSHGNNTNDGHPGSDVATIFDLRNKAAITTRDTRMAFKRHWPTATVLPNGEVLVVGGSEGNNELQNVAYTAEIFNPQSGQWRQDAAMQIPRLYHSSAILLKDGRVLVGGGGAPGPVVGRNAEIYTPDYLTDVTGTPVVRPSVLTGPVRVALGQTFRITADKPVSRMTLVKTGAVTHGYNTDQRFFEASFQTRDGGYDVVFPNDAINATPGLYMLFAFDAKGVPSVGKYLRLPSPLGDTGWDIANDVPTSTAATGTAAVPAGGEVWRKCAFENQQCSFSGTQTVRYGVPGRYAQRTLAGPVMCGNDVFGDPAPGVTKSCEVKGTASSGGATFEPAPGSSTDTSSSNGSNGSGNELTTNVPTTGTVTPMVASHSNLCLSIQGNSNADGAQLIQETCNGSAVQNWIWKAVNGGYSLVNGQSNKCVDVYNLKTNDGAALVQWPCSGNDNQVWKASQTDKGVTLASKATNKCVDVANVSQQSGAQVFQWTCNGQGNQAWKAKVVSALPTDGQTTTVAALHSSLCLSIQGNSDANGAQLMQETCNGSALQKWTWKSVNGGYSLVNGQTNKCVDVYNLKTNDGAALVQWPCSGNDNQIWKAIQTDKGMTLVSKLTNKCVDVANASQQSGAQVFQWTCNKQGNQVWTAR